jgi:hypothetical protein
MTRDQVIEAGIIMGEDPETMELPPEFEDLDYECQVALNLFHILPDKIDGMGGNWLGKEWAGLFDIMEVFNIEDRKDVFEYMLLCQSVYATHYHEQKKIRDSQNKSK